jgi:hypothetical protein
METHYPEIIKADGEAESWQPSKLRRSLIAAGASADLIEDIIDHVERDLRDGMRTWDIYRHAFALLRRHQRPAAAEYSLKKALMQFGPSGFPFERFVARLLEAEGYQTSVGVMMRGECVTHEVDVLAEKEDEVILVEAKYHNSAALKSDVKVALYVDARFRDIRKRLEHEDHNRLNRAWLITNTNFTEQAIAYGTCAGLSLTGWNHPSSRTLQDLVQHTRMHPLTCLTTLSSQQKVSLLAKQAVLCRDLLERPDLLSMIGITGSKVKGVIAEASALCAPRPLSGIGTGGVS